MRIFAYSLLILIICISFQTPLHAQQQLDIDKSFPTIIPASTVLKRTNVSRVKAVIDALRLQLEDGRIIQLSGLDIPDLNTQEPGDIAFAGKQLLEELFLNQKVKIYQTFDEKKGRSNRMGHQLAHLTHAENDLWAQGALIQEGLARVRTTIDNTELVEDMLELEEYARKNIPHKDSDKNKNTIPYLWQENAYKVLSPENAENAKHGYHIAEGRIQKVAIIKNQIYLNFGKNWRNDFTVSILPEHRKVFSKRRLNPVQWQGKTIRVRGWLEEYNGPYIEVDHPERIEFIDPIEEEKKPAEQQNNAIPAMEVPAVNAIPAITKERVKDALPNPKDFRFNQ